MAEELGISRPSRIGQRSQRAGDQQRPWVYGALAVLGILGGSICLILWRRIHLKIKDGRGRDQSRGCAFWDKLLPGMDMVRFLCHKRSEPPLMVQKNLPNRTEETPAAETLYP